ncbi:MAG: mechanosensitive ion channel family protein [Pseudomonadota bacterium]
MFFRLTQWAVVAIVAVFTSLAAAQTETGAASAQEGDTLPQAVDWTLLTNSPAETLESFSRLAELLEIVTLEYGREKSSENYARLNLIVGQMKALIDLSQQSEIAKREVGSRTLTSLMDVFARLGLPDPSLAPAADGATPVGNTPYSIPKTPFRIVQMNDGERAGEWIFEARTVQAAPTFLRGIETLPINPEWRVQNWGVVLEHISGPMIPKLVSDSIPMPLRQPVLGLPIWKNVALAICIVIMGLLIALWMRIVPDSLTEEPSAGVYFSRSLGLLVVNVIIYATSIVIENQLVVTGVISLVTSAVIASVYWLVFAVSFWWLVMAATEYLMKRRQIKEGTIDANMVQLCSRILGIVGVAVLLAVGAQKIGVPILSVLAGLGIGGVAVALAARPTLENLIGGIILFVDKPILVGDYGSFGDKSGTVEKIGARSVVVRSTDRTTTTIPNSRFVDMEIINWSRCDRLHINQAIELRYETTNSQLQYIMAKCKEVFHAHPEVDGATGRAMFVGYSDSALKIIIQAYVNTRYWSVYFAVREDVLLRIKEIIEESGTYFAVPTRNLYFQRDAGIDADRANEAEQELQTWREIGEFPFPRHSEAAIEQLSGTIDYPTYGSPDYVPREEDDPES